MVRWSFLKLTQMFEIFLFLADEHFEATVWASMFHLKCACLFWVYVLYTVDSSLYPFNPRQPLFSPFASLSPSPTLDSSLASHFIHMLHSSCLQALNKDCLSCYFSSLSSLPSPLPLSLYPLDICFPSSFFCWHCFFLCLQNISVSDTRWNDRRYQI